MKQPSLSVRRNSEGSVPTHGRSLSDAIRMRTQNWSRATFVNTEAIASIIASFSRYFSSSCVGRSVLIAIHMFAIESEVLYHSLEHRFEERQECESQRSAPCGIESEEVELLGR